MQKIGSYRYKEKFKRCPACRSSKIKWAFTSPKGMTCVKGFQVDECLNCRLFFVNPQPDKNSLMKFYKALDNDMTIDLRQCFNSYYRKKIHGDLILPLKKYLTKGKILDCGCGFGLFVKLLRNEGFESYGIDLSPKAIASGKKKLKLKNALSCSDLAHYDNQSKFDCISAVAVLEHLENPDEFIQKAASMLKPKGYLMLRYPASDSLQFQYLKSYFNWTQTPYHLFYFSMQSIIALLKKNGFKIVGTHKVLNSWHWTRSIANSLGMLPDYSKWRQDKRFVRWTIALDKCFDQIAYDCDKPSVIHVYAQKQ